MYETRYDPTHLATTESVDGKNNILNTSKRSVSSTAGGQNKPNLSKYLFHDTTTVTIQEANNNHKSLKDPVSPMSPRSSSNAFLSAMRALQTKIATLEAQNKELSEQVAKATAKEKYRMEDCSVLKQQIAKSVDSELKYKEEVGRLIKENESLKKKLNTSLEQEKYLKMEWERSENDKMRHLEKNAVEREEWRSQKNKLIKQLAEDTDRIQSLAKEREDNLLKVDTVSEKFDVVTGLFLDMKKFYEGDLKKLKEEHSKCKRAISDIKAAYTKEIALAKSVILQ